MDANRSRESPMNSQETFANSYRINLLVNGKNLEVNQDSTVSDVLDVLDLGSAPVAVEVNREIVPKSQHKSHSLQQNDQLEIVSLVSGG